MEPNKSRGQHNGAEVYQKLPVSDLKVGMYVTNSGVGSAENPKCYSVEGLITYEEEIAAIMADGYTEVVIDLSKSEVSPPPDKKPQGPGLKALLTQAEVSRQARPERVPISEELPQAEAAYTDALHFARSFTQDFRLGKQVDVQASEPLVESVIDSVSRNGQALYGLCKLKSFDEYTFSHSINVSVISVIYGHYLDLPREQLRELGQAGLFHDIGKTAIPESILNKPDKLTPEEFEAMKMHPALGRDMLSSHGGLSEVILDGVLRHHERYNGKGYPDRKKGHELSLFSKVIGIADVYDALTSQRCYKQAIIPNNALSFMYGLRGEDFEQELLDDFIKCLGIYPLGSLVRLDNGQSGFVVESVANNLLRPKVKVVLDRNMRRIPAKDLDLSVRPTLSIVECLDPASFRLDPGSFVLA